MPNRWLHRFVCELEHVRTFSRKALQVQLLIFQHAAGEAFLTGIQRDHLPGGVERHRGGLLLILSKIPKSQASTRRPGQTSCSAAALMTACLRFGEKVHHSFSSQGPRLVRNIAMVRRRNQPRSCSPRRMVYPGARILSSAIAGERTLRIWGTLRNTATNGPPCRP